MLRRLPLALLLAVSLAGCSSVRTEPASPEQVRAQTADARADLMYQVLVGEIAGQRGDFQTSVGYYVKAAEMSGDPMVAARATHIAVYAGHYEGALRAAQRWAELAPDSLEAQQFAAMLSVRAGDPDAALPYLESVLSLASDDPAEGFALVSQLLAREGQPELAARAMELLVAQHPDVATAHHGLSVLSLAAEDFPRALAAAERALELDPDLIDARISRARALLGMGRADEALASVQQMLTEMPQHHDLRLTYARMLLDQERYGDALDQFERVAQARPGDGDLLFTIGLLSIEAERYDTAETYLQRAIQTGRHVNEAHYYLGRIAEQRGELQDGIAWYAKVVDGEQHFDAQTRIAVLLGRLGHPDRAQDHLAALRDRFTDDAAQVRLFLVEGQVLGEARQYEEAMQTYNEALLLYPGSQDLLYARALMAEKVDRLDILEADLKAILERDPDNATALNALGYTLADRTDRYEEALGYVERALEQRPDDPAVVDSMGWVQYRLGNLEQAEDFLRRAYAQFPDPEVAAHLVEVLWMRGDREEAQSLYGKSIDEHPDSEPLLEVKERLGL